MTGAPLPNHPGCYQISLYVYGPKESKGRLVILKRFGKWSWNWKRAKENHFVYLGPVERFRTASHL